MVRASDDGIQVVPLPDGRAEIQFGFPRAGAKIVFFGAE
jgi:hypothetical protein